METANKQIEQQLTVLFRRVQRIHVYTSSGQVDLDRSAYGIMAKIADEGPQRLGSFATAFGLDPSTITRQVQALERAGFAVRAADPADRRASILDLTAEGADALDRTRAHRRDRLEMVIEDWDKADRTEFARLLTKFNDSMESMLGHS